LVEHQSNPLVLAEHAVVNEYLDELLLQQVVWVVGEHRLQQVRVEGHAADPQVDALSDYLRVFNAELLAGL
jgi:hypothetical protein